MALAALAGGAVLAACSSGSTGSPATSSPTTTAAPGGGAAAATAPKGSNAALKSVVDGITRSAGSSFSVTYLTTHGSTGQSQSVTFAQSPPKSAVITSNGSFYLDGSSVTECQGSGSGANCTTLPSSLTGTVSDLTNLFSPRILTAALKGIEAEAASHAAGVSVSTSSGSYGGLGSTCITVKSVSQPSAVTYCAADSSGILTYANTNGATVTLTAFSANPPAPTFSPPAGATVQTLPPGV